MKRDEELTRLVEWFSWQRRISIAMGVAFVAGAIVFGLYQLVQLLL